MVVIEGMDLPQSCVECRFYDHWNCKVNGTINSVPRPQVTIAYSDKCRGVGCPLRELDVLEELAARRGESNAD